MTQGQGTGRGDHGENTQAASQVGTPSAATRPPNPQGTRKARHPKLGGTAGAPVRLVTSLSSDCLPMPAANFLMPRTKGDEEEKKKEEKKEKLELPTSVYKT